MNKIICSKFILDGLSGSKIFRLFCWTTNTYLINLQRSIGTGLVAANAIAKADDGRLIDPCNGIADLRTRVFRHVSAAFSEDPVRILRVARFAARFSDFKLADQTLALMRSMVASGEVDALVPERVWQEFSRGLMQERPSRMVSVLEDCGAWARVMPEWMPLPVRVEALAAQSIVNAGWAVPIDAAAQARLSSVL